MHPLPSVTQPKTETSPSAYDTFPDFQYPGGLTIWAYRIAGELLLVGVLLSVGFPLLAGQAPNFLAIVVDIVLAIGLFLLQYWARNWTMARAVIGAILIPLVAFSKHDPASAVFEIIIQLGYCGALILLLSGHPRLWRLIVAPVIFLVVCVGIPLGLIGLGVLMAISQGG